MVILELLRQAAARRAAADSGGPPVEPRDFATTELDLGDSHLRARALPNMDIVNAYLHWRREMYADAEFAGGAALWDLYSESTREYEGRNLVQPASCEF